LNKHIKKRKHFFRFRLPALLILVAVCAVWANWWVHSSRQQREAVGRLAEEGADVQYEFQLDGVDRPQLWPSWFVNWLGIDYFADVRSVYLTNMQSTDALKDLNGLQYLYLDGINISNVDLHFLGTLDTLKTLYFIDSPVSDTGLAQFKGLNGLEVLYLDSSQITDKGARHLRNLKSLQVLALHNTQITDSGVEFVKSLDNVRELSFLNTNLSDACLEQFKDLSQLEMLYLGGTDVTDAGVLQLKESLSNCTIKR
jgi:Leucine-rich repeat (LRR) protein